MTDDRRILIYPPAPPIPLSEDRDGWVCFIGRRSGGILHVVGKAEGATAQEVADAAVAMATSRDGQKEA